MSLSVQFQKFLPFSTSEKARVPTSRTSPLVFRVHIVESLVILPPPETQFFKRLKTKGSSSTRSLVPQVHIVDSIHMSTVVQHRFTQLELQRPPVFAGFSISVSTAIESLPAMLQRNYTLMRELDRSLQGVQKQNEQRCEQEIEDIMQGVESGSITPDTSHILFSDEALDEQKHSIRIADEKLALANKSYDLVDAHIQQLDSYLRKLEVLRRERELTARVGSSGLNADDNTGSGRARETGRGRRKKAAYVQQPSMDLDLPVDPNEPTYCICNQVSFGEMVACDNPDCKVEWFHFICVGLKEHPKGKWYCPTCVGIPKRRKGK